ncbi:hypothetical protein FQA39_LY11579 [Lamprigera yunnana]|nr:hypothetical protein FQA39_LY11579 [Lamprigera yunnana]
MAPFIQFVSALTLIFTFFVLESRAEVVELGYYWRDYNGIIPRDAFPAGQDENGESIYIGQVLYYDKLLPAKIYRGDRKAYYTWGIEYSTAENVQILCSRHSENLKWVAAEKNGLHQLINTFLVKGGSEPVYDIYIGRAFHKMQTLPGRIRAGNVAHLNLGLYVSVPGKEVILPSFEVLTYDPKAIDNANSSCTKNVLIMN